MAKETLARKVEHAKAQADAKLLAEHGHAQPSLSLGDDAESRATGAVALPHQMRSSAHSVDLEDSMTFIDDESDSGGAKLAPTPVKSLRAAAGDAARRSAEDAQRSLRERLKGAQAARPADTAPPLAGSVFSASSAAAYVESMRPFREPAEAASSLSDGLSGGLSSGPELGNGAEFGRTLEVGRGFGASLNSISFTLGATSVESQSRTRTGELDVNRGSAI